jgi:hypothetical protein
MSKLFGIGIERDETEHQSKLTKVECPRRIEFVTQNTGPSAFRLVTKPSDPRNTKILMRENGDKLLPKTE